MNPGFIDANATKAHSHSSSRIFMHTPISSGRPPVLGRGNRRFTARIGAGLCKMLYMDFDEKAPFPTLGE